MASIKCKMCGGNLEIVPGESVAQCEYCNTTQTVPNVDNEKKLNLFSRANRLRANCEFDKAAGVYETIAAEFPQEAEAYWGLVLCKYGIEYVDDPATGKKIPTCHRSSFNSIMEDADFEQALENADVLAKRVYRDEAKAIEEIRKGIIAVSSKEAPYDIFICYKETADDGERTLDSVLAQDIYDALTDKGYRVFFSRITLEDKLGQAYEPYIFAALNSAKIMLVVGTDYEYFNAVWVKNEWSRYLKLMAEDRTKHLIPCYKGIDAYDMPKEFAKLQAQNLDQIGYMQNLLRGIDKLLPRNTKTETIKETVVVQQAGTTNTLALLKRGNMALEDKEWEKADGFFDEVLNHDVRCAEGYAGKFLAQQKESTLSAWTKSFLQKTQSGKPETLTANVGNEQEIQDLLTKYMITGYIHRGDVKNLLKYDKDYTSTAKSREMQLQQARKIFEEDKSLGRAYQFAEGTYATEINQLKENLLSKLEERLTQAEAQAEANRQKVVDGYENHLLAAESELQKWYERAEHERNQHYEYLCDSQKTTNNAVYLQEIMQKFKELGDYKDAPARAQQCLERIRELEQAEADAKQAKLKAAQEKERKKKQTTILCAVVAVVVVIAVVASCFAVILPEQQRKNNQSAYEEAVALETKGDIVGAAIAFAELGDYEDASERSMTLWNGIAQRKVLCGNNSEYGKGFALIQKNGQILLEMDESYREDYGDEYTQWKDIISVAMGADHLFGLKADGTVEVCCDYSACGMCSKISEWTNVVDITAGEDFVLGLTAEGTAISFTSGGYTLSGTSRWKNVIAVAGGSDHAVGLTASGTVVFAGEESMGENEVGAWDDIIAIATGTYQTVGLKADGTVVVAGNNSWDQHDAMEWTGITAIACGSNHILGLKADGTAVAVGNVTLGACRVDDWKDIVNIAAAGDYSYGIDDEGNIAGAGLKVLNNQ